MAAAPCVYDQPVNTSTDHGETSLRTDSAKSLTSFITADVPPCLRQAEFRVRSVLLGVELRSPRVRICDDGSQVVDVRHFGTFLW